MSSLKTTCLTVTGFNEIAFQMFGRSLQPLPPGSVVKPQLALEIGAHVRTNLNERLTALASEHHAPVHDLYGLFRRVKEEGISIGNRRLNAEYLGGFYSLNGFYPGATGQATIANEILQILNREYGAAFSAVDLACRFWRPIPWRPTGRLGALAGTQQTCYVVSSNTEPWRPKQVWRGSR